MISRNNNTIQVMTDDDSSDTATYEGEENEIYTIAGTKITRHTVDNTTHHQHNLPRLIPDVNHRTNTTSISTSASQSNHRSYHEKIYRTSFIDHQHHQRKEEQHDFHSNTSATRRYQPRGRIDIDSQQKHIVDIGTRPQSAEITTSVTTITKKGKTVRTPIYKQVPRTKNFQVKVYRNGDSSRYVWCMSCSMELLLVTATRKFQMSTMFTRLFDTYGQEIFRSEDILRGMEYYVSTGEDFISPLRAIRLQLEYALHSRWTIYGIERYYARKKRPQKEKPDQSKELILVNEIDLKAILRRNRRTQTYKHDPQHENHDCPAQHKCVNRQDTSIKPSLIDKFVQINRLFYQTEHHDCRKHHQCPNNRDKSLLIDNCTQTSTEHIPILENVDIPKEYTTMSEPDMKVELTNVVILDPQIEHKDQYKYSIQSSPIDRILSIQKENHDLGKLVSFPNKIDSPQVQPMIENIDKPKQFISKISPDPIPLLIDCSSCCSRRCECLGLERDNSRCSSFFQKIGIAALGSCCLPCLLCSKSSLCQRGSCRSCSNCCTRHQPVVENTDKPKQFVSKILMDPIPSKLMSQPPSNSICCSRICECSGLERDNGRYSSFCQKIGIAAIGSCCLPCLLCAKIIRCRSCSNCCTVYRPIVENPDTVKQSIFSNIRDRILIIDVEYPDTNKIIVSGNQQDRLASLLTFNNKNPDLPKQATVKNPCDEYPYESRCENFDPFKSPVPMNKDNYRPQYEKVDSSKTPILINKYDDKPPQREKPDKLKRPISTNIKDGKLPLRERVDLTKLPSTKNKKDRPFRSRTSSPSTTTSERSNVPLSRRHYRTGNFHVRVYKNNDFSRFAYCKSCSMTTILSEATQKLCLSTGARHLYDFNGKEVFTHEDIQQNKSYYVT